MLVIFISYLSIFGIKTNNFNEFIKSQVVKQDSRINIDLQDEIIYNQVHYLNLYKINDYKNLDILIIVRYINYFLYNHHYAKKTFIWICDTIINPVYNGDRLHNNASHLIHNVKDKINGLIFLSDWHKYNNNHIIDLTQFQNHIIFNPIDFFYYKPN